MVRGWCGAQCRDAVQGQAGLPGLCLDRKPAGAWAEPQPRHPGSHGAEVRPGSHPSTPLLAPQHRAGNLQDADTGSSPATLDGCTLGVTEQQDVLNSPK